MRLFVNIKRDYWAQGKGDEAVVAAFARNFRKNVWSYGKLPEVYYDPRALDDDKSSLSCLHAKSVMIDDRKVLITSANFSEAAQVRNIEAGVIIEDECLTVTYCRNFQRLVDDGLLVRLDFGE